MFNRICKKCNENKSLDNFSKAGIIKGVQYYRYLCIPCYSESKKPRQDSLKEKFYKYKKTLKCSNCGYNDFRALQFHHFSDDKDFAVADMVRRGFAFHKIMEEISKCIVLCANCHQIEHFKDRDIA